MKRKTAPKTNVLEAPNTEENALLVMIENERITKSLEYTLNAIKVEADEKTRTALADQAWKHVDELSQQVEESVYMVGIANDMRLFMMEQRDTAVRALKDVAVIAENNVYAEVQRDMKAAIERILMELCGFDGESELDVYTAKFFATLFVTGYGAQYLNEATMPTLGDWMREQVNEAVR